MQILGEFDPAIRILALGGDRDATREIGVERFAVEILFGGLDGGGTCHLLVSFVRNLKLHIEHCTQWSWRPPLSYCLPGRGDKLKVAPRDGDPIGGAGETIEHQPFRNRSNPTAKSRIKSSASSSPML